MEQHFIKGCSDKFIETWSAFLEVDSVLVENQT